MRERPHAGVPKDAAGEDQTPEQRCLVVAAPRLLVLILPPEQSSPAQEIRKIKLTNSIKYLPPKLNYMTEYQSIYCI